MSTIVQNLAREFDGIDEYMKAVGAILRDGFMPDLTGLDERVSEVCISMQNAEPEIQQQFFERMEQLLKRLDVIEAEIRAFHEAQVKNHA